ncbi:LEA type 2 family protein [Hymenobacter sp. BRD128]|uniref:NDR1/HIN1-like protein n=1 Tax=Hymenobacter sp. BRD128 TaxID=2675878 RepID=UPI001565655E|nr:LEA type 2 family protein [Hymenobacter sp. BRD128]QKG56003.1 LEA type 2 family protein [Hymenobacter sp. BRD128]
MFASFLTRHRGAAQVIAGVLAVAGLSQCGIHEQVQQAKAFKNVDVRLASIDQATVGGVNVLNLRQAADLGTAERALLLAAYTSGNLPLRMRANLEFRNPNNETAALNEFDYIALIDGKEVAKGHTTQRIEVPANGGVTTAPIQVESNLRQVLGDQTGESLANFALGLTDRDRQPLRFTLKLKPTFITSSGRRISPPGYSTVEKEFTPAQALDAVSRPDSVRRP